MPLPLPLRALLDSVFPWTTCAACREDAELTNGLCDACRATFHPSEPYYDARIGARVASAYAYGGAARDMAHRMKFNGEYDIARFLAPVMAERIAQAGYGGVLVPVPLHWRKRLARGYNQAAVLCDELSAITGLACHPRALKRTRNTRAQMNLTREQRSANVQGAFRATAAVQNQSVILVDDIITTGSTVRACMSALYEAGAVEVVILTACCA